MPTYSFVVPVCNEEGVLRELHRRLSAVADQLDGESEFILVDDGSTDASRDVMLDLRASDPRLRLLFLSRNFGHQIAISAGLDFAMGEAVVIMDGDLQDPPEVVLELAARWREGNEIVHAVRTARPGEGRFKLWTAHAFYRLLRRIANVDMPLDAGDFRLVSRRVADTVRNMREPDRYLRGMFAWVGFRQACVTYERDQRYAGDTKIPLTRMMRFAVDGILGFSTAPLRLILAIGFAFSGLALALGVVAITLKVAGALPPVAGWASLTVLLSFFAGIQLIVLGTVGLYVSRAYEQGKQRPLYLVASAYGLTSPAAGGADDLMRPELHPAEPPLDYSNPR
jgi:polyisoprenyl-phosphate glycosyltransferase